MKKILQQLFEHQPLTILQAKEVMLQIGKGVYTDAEIASFITVYLMRTISIAELIGFKEALLEMALPVYFNDAVIDIVGTGGDGKNTFNISTISSFVVAGTGVKVAKHGNYASTSVTGSSNVMEQLGYQFKSDTSVLQKELDTANITFLHAPVFHPALKVVSHIRKQMGVRTVFNMLGPLVNPAKPTYRLLGVYNAETARLYNYLMQQTQQHFAIVNSLDGYDEISLTTDTKVITPNGEKIYTAYELGKRTVAPDDITGGQSPADAAKIFLQILKGEGTWAQNAVVFANAAMALYSTDKFESYDACHALAVDSLESGKALQSFKKLIR
ncbi:anthranilate phosphoribosyltransferase [Ferruginibacter yonginensis]|uniref:Anthranilate phosphoribosyltransferase n=1 Tax=Ferruginibacter yonginensis TaxID=1310416 RepID=A0ABV8QQ33_9BACT